MKVFSKLEPQIRRSLWVLFSAGLLFWASIAVLLPTLPLYIKKLGATSQQVGIVMASFAIGLLLLRPTLGQLADQRSRKLVVLIGMVVVAIAPLGYLFVTSIPLLMAVRAFHGISIAAFTTGYTALITELSPRNQRGEVIGYMSLVQPLGVAIGPAVGGFLQAACGFEPLFLLSSTLGILGWLYAVQIFEPSHTQQSHQDQQHYVQRSFWQMLWSPPLRVPTLVMLMIGLVLGTVITFIPLFLQDTKSELNPGLFYTAAAIASFGVRLLIGRASDRYGRGLFISGSLVCFILSMLMLTSAHTPILILLASFIEGAGVGTLIPTIIALISDRSTLRERGQVFALCLGGLDLGIAIAGPIQGYFADVFGYRNMFAIAAFVAFLSLISFLTLSSKNLTYSLRFALGRTRDIYAIPE